MTKVFISHKSEDESSALWLNAKLAHSGIEAYVDKLDPVLNSPRGEGDLGEYFRWQLQRCTHLVAVISESTRQSWWVPFEIGIATEREYPLATLADQGDLYRRYPGSYSRRYEVPEYLRKWPYLETELHVDNYILALKHTPMVTRFTENVAGRHTYTMDFYSNLRRLLGQG